MLLSGGSSAHAKTDGFCRNEYALAVWVSATSRRASRVRASLDALFDQICLATISKHGLPNRHDESARSAIARLSPA